MFMKFFFVDSFGNANNENNTPQLKSGYDTFDQHLQVTEPIPPYSKQARRFSSKHDVSASAAEYMSIMWEKTSILSKTKMNSGMLRETSKQLRLNSQVDFSAYNDTEPSVNKVHEGRVKRSRQENNEPVEMENILAKDIDSEKSSERGSDKPTEEENSEEDSDESYGMPGRGKR